MAAIIKLEDGSDLYASSLGISGALACIAEGVEGTHHQLSRWLSDVAQRPAPFMDLDLRGLDDEARASFWLAVDYAHERFAEWDQDASYSWCVEVIRSLFQRREVRLSNERENVPPLDLSELWFADDAA
ncbi:hypothetical protein [Allosphingosinicella deserti]|uniref:Uncharacterized protein n=1 Tax=Allosphingosinicella deserti TaxID=2116704 RepID=A0A2P7QSR1_9SPHN|nr:hypothetical protein [Sphingomonas deserti]PSJ40970.1 hypothetical protein C7I55_11975 [Sphingomonas deserti]